MREDALIHPPRSRTAHEFVRQTLREAILNGTLPTGQHLVQSELAEKLEVSTTPVREALRNLASEGLVVFDPHRGAIVRALDISEVRELYELRSVLEPIMIRRVVKQITPQQLSEAKTLHQKMDRDCPTTEWADLNRKFHAVFDSIDTSSRLASLINGLRDSAAPYVALSLDADPQQIKSANDEHRALMELYSSGSTDEIIRLTLDHYQATLSVIEEWSARHDAPQSGSVPTGAHF